VKTMLNVISLGAGVQSSTMALMAAKGELPAVDFCIFADTRWEPRAIYDHLDFLEKEITQFPIYRVSTGDLRQDMIDNLAPRSTTGKSFSAIPWFTDKGGMGRRQCTYDYKIHPIVRSLRLHLGYKPRQRIPVGSVKLSVGISTDECSRMRPNRERWIENVYPLVDVGMSRMDCISWFAKHYPDRKLQKSSCLGCPFHNDAMWRELKMGDKDEWEDTVYVDRMIREGGTSGSKQYMHRSLKPLDEIDFRNLEDMGQLNMFEEDCEGMCGV